MAELQHATAVANPLPRHHSDPAQQRAIRQPAQFHLGGGGSGSAASEHVALQRMYGGLVVTLTPDLVAEVRAVAREELERYGTPWAEHMALRQLVWDRFNSLPSDEAALLAQLLSALDELGIRELLTAVELLEKGMVARGPGGDRLRLVYARFVDRPHPGKAFGRFLTRCSFVPVGCHYLCRVSPPNKSESALYRLTGFSAQLPSAVVAPNANTAQDAGLLNYPHSS